MRKVTVCLSFQELLIKRGKKGAKDSGILLEKHTQIRAMSQSRMPEVRRKDPYIVIFAKRAVVSLRIS
jgi:hypothetical protein